MNTRPGKLIVARHETLEVTLTKLRLQPGDLVVCEAKPDRLTPQAAEALRDELRRLLPDDVRCIVTLGAFDLRLIPADELRKLAS